MPGARYRDLMPGWAPEYLPPEVPVLEIVSVWPLSGACRRGWLPERVHCGMPAAMGRYRDFRMDIRCRWGLLPGFRVVIRRFLPDRPPEFSGIAVCRRCGPRFCQIKSYLC